MLATRRSSRQKRDQVSLAHVARTAGVSTATVSRVLNLTGPVSDETRRRVEQVVDTLGYSPNSFAQALASQRSRTLGVIVPSIRNSIFAPGVEAMQHRAAQDQYTVLLATSDYDLDQELQHVKALVARGVDGLILVGQSHHPELKPFLQLKKVPYVCQSSFAAAGPHPNVGFDNAKSMARVTRHLLALGHRQFGVIAGISSGNDRVIERIAGVRRALRRAGLGLVEGGLIECRYDIGEARGAMGRLLDLDKPPTAVVCINDVLAMGAMFECTARGVTVPGQVSITGFDDYEFGQHMIPSLTTVRVPTDRIGIRAVENLLAQLAGQPVTWAEEIDVALIERQSTAPPPSRQAGRHGR